MAPWGGDLAAPESGRGGGVEVVKGVWVFAKGVDKSFKPSVSKKGLVNVVLGFLRCCGIQE